MFWRPLTFLSGGSRRIYFFPVPTSRGHLHSWVIAPSSCVKPLPCSVECFSHNIILTLLLQPLILTRLLPFFFMFGHLQLYWVCGIIQEISPPRASTTSIVSLSHIYRCTDVGSCGSANCINTILIFCIIVCVI